MLGDADFSNTVLHGWVGIWTQVFYVQIWSSAPCWLPETSPLPPSVSHQRFTALDVIEVLLFLAHDKKIGKHRARVCRTISWNIEVCNSIEFAGQFFSCKELLWLLRFLQLCDSFKLISVTPRFWNLSWFLKLWLAFFKVLSLYKCPALLMVIYISLQSFSNALIATQLEMNFKLK